MPSIPVHISRPSAITTRAVENPLPQLLHTPSGLALLEVQGTIHFPTTPGQSSTQVGKLVFPLYDPEVNGADDTKWMKRVYMYVGKGQRLTGECKKLPKPIGIMRKRERKAPANADMDEMDEEERSARDEELEIVEVVKHKIVFSLRPEPISGVPETS